MDKMRSVLDILKKSEAFLKNKGVESPRLEAELLIAHCLDCGRMDLYLQFERPLTDGHLDALRPLLARRGRREPLAYILGKAAFFDMDLSVGPGVLIPRPETEELLEGVEKRLPTPPSDALDLGTGSGAIALWMKGKYEQCAVTAVDFSENALRYARANGEQLKREIRWVCGDWTSPPPETLDLIVSNPPYLTDEEWANAAPEVRNHEPREALVGGEDGLRDLLEILRASFSGLRPGGLLALETGIDQHGPVLEAARSAGYADTEGVNDLSGRPRFIYARKAGS